MVLVTVAIFVVIVMRVHVRCGGRWWEVVVVVVMAVVVIVIFMVVVVVGWWPLLSFTIVIIGVCCCGLLPGESARCHAPNTFGTVNMEHTIDSSLSWREQ